MNSLLLLLLIQLEALTIICRVKVLGPSKVTNEIKKYHPKRGILYLII